MSTMQHVALPGSTVLHRNRTDQVLLNTICGTKISITGNYVGFTLWCISLFVANSPCMQYAMFTCIIS